MASSSFHSSPNVGYFVDPNNAPKNEPNYYAWTWQQIEAAICGGSMLVPSGDGAAIAKGFADPTTLWQAGDSFEFVRQTLEMVAKSLLDQAKALAGGSGAPWTGEAANVFYDTMTLFSQQVQANADVLTGTGGFGGTIPQQLVSNGNSLSWSQAAIMAIDEWYAAQALKQPDGTTNPDGLVHISQFPNIVKEMTSDMLTKVLIPLSSDYKVTYGKIRSPDTTFTNLGSGNGSPAPSSSPPPVTPPPAVTPPPVTPPPVTLGGVNSPNAFRSLNPPGSLAPPSSKLAGGRLTSPVVPFGGLPLTDFAGDPLGGGGLWPSGGSAGGGIGGVGGANLPSSPGEPDLGKLAASPLGEELSPGTGTAGEIPTSEAGAAGLDEMPMMPGMGGLGAGAGGAQERSDASGLLGGEEEPWLDEAPPEDLVAGAAAGGAGLEGFEVFSAEADGADPDEPRQDAAAAGELLAAAAGEADPEAEVTAWGTALGAVATVLTIPSAGPEGDEAASDDASLARWRPAAVEPGAALARETAPRAVAGPPPPGPPPEPSAPAEEAKAAAGRGEESGEESGQDGERTAADLLVGDESAWGLLRGDPGDL